MINVLPPSGHRRRLPRLAATAAIVGLISALFVATASSAAAATAGPNAPAAAANVTGIGTVAWASPANALSSNNTYAGAGLANTTSNYLRLTNFGLVIPAGSTINGVSVAVERSSSSGAANVRDVSVKLVKASVVTGTEHANTALQWPTTDVVANYGSGNDLWGTTLTQADVTNAGFGVVIAAQNLNSTGTFARIDAVTITVTYTAGGGGSPPVNTSPPAISGTPTVGVATAASPGNWTNSPTSYAYQWQLCSPTCANIAGQTSPSYTPVAGDVGKTLKVQVIASNASGSSAPALSAASAAVVAGGGGSTQTVTRSPGVGASVAGPGTVAWTTPNNALASDGAVAYAGLASNGSAYLRLTSFGFAVPAGATINGVSVAVERSSSSASANVRDTSVKLVKASAVTGSEHANTALQWPTADTVAIYGSGSDLWGTTLTQADVNNAGFGVVIAAQNLNSAGTFARIDAVTITVTYTGSGPPPGGDAYTATFISRQVVAGAADDDAGTAWVGEWVDANGDIWISWVQSTGPKIGAPAWAINRYPPGAWTPSVAGKDIWGATNSRQYMKSTDNGATWTLQYPRGGTTPDSLITDRDGMPTPTSVTSCSSANQTNLPSGSGCPAIAQIPYSAQADIMRADGTIVRRVNGEDVAYNLGVQRTAYLQTFKPGVDTTWSAPQYLLDPNQYTYQISRIEELSDGRWVALGQVWDAPEGTRTGSTPVHHLVMVSSNEGLTWAGNALNAPAGVTLPPLVNEWDAAELPNGDLIAVFRVAYQNQPWQAVLAANGSGGWDWTNAAQSPMPYTGHPEVLTTAEGAVLYIGSRATYPAAAPWGAWSMTAVDAEAGLNNWQLVQFTGAAAAAAAASGNGCTQYAGQGYYQCWADYYPHAEQADNGDIVVVSWVGGDNPYPPVDNQYIVVTRFRLNP